MLDAREIRLDTILRCSGVLPGMRALYKNRWHSYRQRHHKYIESVHALDYLAVSIIARACS